MKMIDCFFRVVGFKSISYILLKCCTSFPPVVSSKILFGGQYCGWSLFDLTFCFLEKRNLESPAVLTALAITSNKIISLTNPCRRF